MIPKKILFCTDFSENALPAKSYAVDFAKAFGASLSVLHVINSSRLSYPALDAGVPFDLESIRRSIEESVKVAFNDFIAEFQGQLTEIPTTSRVGVPAVEITQFVEENGIDMIVMGTHGWTGFRHLILGSTAENVVRKAKCPVLTVKSSTSGT